MRIRGFSTQHTNKGEAGRESGEVKLREDIFAPRGLGAYISLIVSSSEPLKGVRQNITCSLLSNVVIGPCSLVPSRTLVGVLVDSLVLRRHDKSELRNVNMVQNDIYSECECW